MSSTLKQKLLDLSILENFDDYTSSELVDMLKYADECYFNETCVITDEEYDCIKRVTQQMDPYHPYFGSVGVSVRTGKTKLPFTMGSLDQLYQGGDVAHWLDKWNLNGETFIVSHKLDGVSGMIVYDANGNFSASYSRGDGVEGAVLDRHVTKFNNVPMTNCLENLVVRGEIIFSKEHFTVVSTKIKTKGGTFYKNARNCIAGLMNAEEIDRSVYPYIDFVAYEMVNSTLSKSAQLETLQQLGFKVPSYQKATSDMLTDVILETFIDQARRGSYEVDGVVVDVDSATKRQNMIHTKDTLNPGYAIKYKLADSANCAHTTVTHVEWSPSKHGYLKPVVVFEPVNLCGVTITRATGFNAGFIRDNGVGPGCVVEIVRSGDVIPFINRVVSKATSQFPTDVWEWNETNVDAVLVNPEHHDEVLINRNVDFFATLGVTHLKEGNIRELFKHGMTEVADIINASEQTLVSFLGENGHKIFRSINDKLQNVQLYELLGAHSMHRGIGVRKIKKIFNSIGYSMLQEDISVERLASIDGFDTKTAVMAKGAIDAFKPFFDRIHEKVTLSSSDVVDGNSPLKGNVYVFTGFRDNKLEKRLEKAGATVASGVSKKVTAVIAKDIKENSTKIQKAEGLGITVTSLETFESFLEDHNI